MKAIILAGGQGARLKGFTDNCPKHFLPVLGKSLIYYIVDNLIKYGIDNIEFSLHYRKKYYIKNLLKVYDNKSVNFDFSYDKLMLGPWRPILDILNDQQPLIACAGDIFANVNYRDLVAFHKKQGRPVTLVVAKTYPTPRAMTFKVKDNHLIDCQRVKISSPDDFINIGIYIVNKDILKFIPGSLNSFFEDDLFDIFVKNRIASAYILSGKNFNINTPYNLFCANLHQLKNTKINIDRKKDRSSCSIIRPVFIERGVKIEKGSVVGPNVVLGRDVIIKKGSQIKNSIIHFNSQIKAGSKISYSLISPNSEIAKNTVLERIIFCNQEKRDFGINLSYLENEIKKKN